MPFVYHEHSLPNSERTISTDIAKAVANWLLKLKAQPSTFVAYLGALACTVGPDALPDRGIPVRLAQAAVDGFPEGGRAQALVALGAANFRAGAPDEAVRRLTEAIQRGENTPRAWAFLAMAHLAAGHGEDARPWIDRLKKRNPSKNAVDFWDEVEIDILRRDVELMGKRHENTSAPRLPANVLAPADQ